MSSLSELIDKTRLGHMLLQHEKIAPTALELALSKQLKTGKKLGEVLHEDHQVDNALIEGFLKEQNHLRSLYHNAEDALVASATRIGTLLEKLGHAKAQDIEHALAKQNQSGGQLGDILVRNNIISLQALQALHDVLAYQKSLRSVLLGSLAALVISLASAPLHAEVGRSSTASFSISLTILPSAPRINYLEDDGSSSFDPITVTGATLTRDESGIYYAAHGTMYLYISPN